ncbi:MAG: hypothetical protein Q8N23_26995 [Archangium sp.]|nr:hypothetical protein [Archangium sp.]MDP3156353.1 hypothetical protein [Archangium sp.]MDP3570397.1 hypothetical protein [Archangium sp.]
MFLTTLLSALLAAPAAPNAEKPIKPLPTLGKEPKVDGELKDLAPSLDFKMPESAIGSSSSVGLKAAFKKDTLFLGVTVNDDKLLGGDQLDVTLYFPDSGTTSKGVVYRFGADGLRDAPADIGAPAFAQALVKAAAVPSKTGYVLEIAVPARALPRFQAFKQLALSICVDYADVDMEGGEASKITSCPTGEMASGPTRIPDELRKTLKLTPTADVEGIEAREKGWLGFSKLHYPTWAQGDETFTQESLAALIAGDTAIPPASVALPAVKLVLNDNRPIFTILTGKNPYVKEKCISENELRMAMYVTKDRTASRVLEWPAATCKLGRAMRLELGAEGSLEIGYTTGTTHHFSWTVDHFERSELGMKQ